MKNALANGLAVIVVLMVTMTPSLGQKSGGTPPPTPTPTPTPRPTPVPTPGRVPNTPRFPTTLDPSISNDRILSGRVLLNAGSAPPESVVVEQVCGANVRARTFTDSKGNFTLVLSRRNQMSQIYDASDSPASMSQPVTLMGCDLRAVLNGYISSELHLDRWSGTTGETNVGNIVLSSRSGTSTAASISVTSLQVPPNARKEYDKGLAAMRDEDFKKAQQKLQKAVDIYPKYAAAWVALGRISEREKDKAKAREAYSQAITADPQYLTPYIYLGYVAASENKWDEVLSLTTKAISIDPRDYFEPHFLNAVANANLNHPEDAMKSALRAAEIDSEHREPRIHLLLARLYANKGDREQAAAQLRLFIQYSPENPESTMAKASLKRLEDEKAQK